MLSALSSSLLPANNKLIDAMTTLIDGAIVNNNIILNAKIASPPTSSTAITGSAVTATTPHNHFITSQHTTIANTLSTSLIVRATTTTIFTRFLINGGQVITRI